MNNSVYVLLVTRYKNMYELPKKFETIKDINIKIELLALAINKKTKLEDLEEYKKIIGD